MSAAERVQSVTRRARFAAARRLWSTALDLAANQQLFGRETRLHGHDFTLYVTVRGPVAPGTGMVMDLKALSELIRAEIVSPLDRTDLCEAEMLGGLPPTTENLAIAVWWRLAPRLPAGSLEAIELWEGGDKRVSYRGE